MTTCEKCGAQYEAPEWPFCPHGRASMKAFGDDIPGGMYFENGFSEPRKFYSHSEHRAALDKEGLQIAPRYVEGNKVGMVNWAAAPDQKTLENAAILITRGAEPRAKRNLLPDPSNLPNEITVSDAGWSVKPSEAGR